MGAGHQLLGLLDSGRRCASREDHVGGRAGVVGAGEGEGARHLRLRLERLLLDRGVGDGVGVIGHAVVRARRARKRVGNRHSDPCGRQEGDGSAASHKPTPAAAVQRRPAAWGGSAYR